ALSSVFGLLAVLSNIPFLNFYWPLLAVLTVLTISSVPFEVEKPGRALATLAVRSAPLAISALVCMMSVGPPILKLREMEQFFIGGQVGFWDDTVGSLIVTSLYRQPYAGDVRPVIAAGVIAVMVLHLLLSICNLIRGRPFASFERLALLFILVCS